MIEERPDPEQLEQESEKLSEEAKYIGAHEELDWHGKPLNPATALVWVAAQQIGLMVYQAELDIDGQIPPMYNGIYRDAAVMTWLMLQDIKTVRWSIRKPKDAFEKVINFIEKHDLGRLNNPDTEQAMRIWGAVIADQSSQKDVEDKEGKADSQPRAG